jgi:hypothetical protein
LIINFKAGYSLLSEEALAKVLNNNVAANFSLRVLFYFNTLQTQAKACGYQNRTFARGSEKKKYPKIYDPD